MKLCRAGARIRQGGQSLVEFVIVAPVLLFFCFGLLQYALLFQARATLDSATLEAAREGAVNHAELDAMQRGLARGLSPLYAYEANAAGASAALARADQAVRDRAASPSSTRRARSSTISGRRATTRSRAAP
ncbi:TadE family protein [Burkholderia gladioli]|uniref:TadE family protein n=1 Tax=Burkholderia gladioli TaxID=28095 RepID=UPI0031330181